MKTIFTLLFSVFAFQAFATCPQVTGKYLCPKELEWDLIFESPRIEIKEVDFFGYKIFSLKSDKSNVFYILNEWAPYMDELNEIMHNDVGTSAVCKKNELHLKLKILPPEEENNEDPFIMTYKISPLKEGIKVNVFMEDQLAVSAKCKKLP